MEDRVNAELTTRNVALKKMFANANKCRDSFCSCDEFMKSPPDLLLSMKVLQSDVSMNRGHRIDARRRETPFPPQLMQTETAAQTGLLNGSVMD